MTFDHHDHQALTSPDFFLWGFLKERVYRNNTRNLEDFKHTNEVTITDTDQQNLLQTARKKRSGKDERLSSKGTGKRGFRYLS
jgi:hypothetical protein